MNCYVLTGGRSLRMGKSKTSLFLDRVVAAAAPLFDEVVAVERAGAAPIAGLRTIHERAHLHEAAIFGVARSLEDARGDAFLLAVDYPLVTPELLELLRDERRVPVWNGQPQPLCAVWTEAARARVEEAIAAGRFDLRGVCEQEMIGEASLRSRFRGEPLMNVNTPEELEEAERSYGR